MKPTLIIDYDDTLTALPAFWNEVIDEDKCRFWLYVLDEIR